MKTYITYWLRKTPFFSGISPEAGRRLAEVCQVRAIRKGEVLFREQAPGEALFILEKGAVQLFKTSPDGAEVVIRTIRPGEVFAEVILFEQRRYPVTARAAVASRALCFLRRDILHLLDERAFRDEFIAMLMRKQRYLAERIHDLAAFSVEERFFRFLREQFGESRTITPGMSKKEIASSIGATPETLSRLIQRLTRKRVLKWRGKTIELREGFWETQ